METKICTKCLNYFPNNEKYFQFDSVKYNLARTVYLSAACKKCKAEQAKIRWALNSSNYKKTDYKGKNYKELRNKRDNHKIELMDDYYIARLILGKKNKLKPKDIINDKELISLYKMNLTVKREIKNGK